MLAEIKGILYFGNHFFGVEHTSKNGEEVLYVSELRKRKKEVSKKAVSTIKTILDLKELLPNKQHVFLIINNENVITKSIESPQKDHLKLLFTAFPNINPDEFVYEVVSSKSTHFVSICRKVYVDDLILDYKKNGVSVINISLGNLIINSVLKFIETDKIESSNATIIKNEQDLLNIQSSNSELAEYDVNGLKVNSTYLLSLSGALSTVLGLNNENTNYEKQKLSYLNQFKQARFTSSFIKVGLGLILVLLLVNFFFFNHYFNTVNSLGQTAQINQSTKTKVLQLSDIVSKNKKQVDDMLKGGSSKSSFYADALINSMPSSILLNELNYQPLLKRIKKDKMVENETGVILISGESAKSELFSKWIAELEAETFVNTVEILDFGNISHSNSSFKIKLNISHD